MSEHIVTLSDDSFDSEVLQSDLPVLVDFWAEWCGPCKMLAPILDEVAQNGDYASKVKFAKLNVDENNQSAAKYGVRGIPTLLLFKGGEVIANQVGAVTKSQLVAFLDSNI
jgi:thioredoxin 1